MIDIGTRFGRAIHSPEAKRTEPQPAAFEAAVNGFLTKFKPQIDAAELRASTLNGEAATLVGEADTLDQEAKALRKQKQPELATQKEALAEQKRTLADTKIQDADTALSKFGYDTSRISGIKGRDLLFEAQGGAFTKADAREALDQSDAGHAMTAAKNATLWVAGFGYGTHHAMQAAISDLPADKKVIFNVICTPSSHYGSDETDAQASSKVPTPGSKRANFESNARTNEYIARVLYTPDPNGSAYSAKEIASVKFKVKDPSKPEYASMSPDLAVDLTEFKGGKLIIEGWCTASAGVGGYEETRRTEIKL